MRVGHIHTTQRFVLDDSFRARFSLLTFTISLDSVSFVEMFHSAFASPARYVMELFRRLTMLEERQDGESCFLINPLFEMTPDLLQRLLSAMVQPEEFAGPTVVADSTNKPLGYFLPAAICREDDHYLSLLSAVNARLDQKLLNVLFCGSGSILALDWSACHIVGNRFPPNPDLWLIYEWSAKQALSLLSRLCHPTASAMPPATRENFSPLALRDSIRFCAIMPHHAGDVLFYALAARYTDSHIIKIVVNRRYTNIIDDVLPGYQMVTIDHLPPYRDGTGILQCDEDYFLDYSSVLAPFSFYYYCRQSRDYNMSNFHLIDQFAFALGQSFLSSEELVTATKPFPPVYRTSDEPPPFRILLHFDAGWGLKIYPQPYQDQLIEELLAAGALITILGIEDRDFGHYRSVKFKGLDWMKEMFSNHHLLVGSDSFPSHYAAHVFGLPTICLFGPTKPVNSDARPSISYKALERGLRCRPCGELESCLETRKKQFCHNFVPPAQLKEEIFLMLQSIYSRQSN